MHTLIAFALVLMLAVLGSIGFIYSGSYNVAATEPHWPLTSRILETARTRSIKAQAADIKIPPDMAEPGRLPMGVVHFAAHCAVCHGAPGVPKGDIGRGLYPSPPDLTQTGTNLSDAEMFWVIKNGINMTGMPAWADHADEEIWATVAFLKKLPGMTAEEYAKLIIATMRHGEHQHPAADHAGAPAAGSAAPPQEPHRHQ